MARPMGGAGGRPSEKGTKENSTLREVPVPESKTGLSGSLPVDSFRVLPGHLRHAGQGVVSNVVPSRNVKVSPTPPQPGINIHELQA